MTWIITLIVLWYYSFYHLPRPLIGIPLPLPLAPPLPLMPGGLDPSSLPAAAAYCYSLLAFLMVWSTDKIVHAASVAAVKTLCLTISGSQTNFSIKSSIWPSRTLTPNHIPSDPPVWCFCLNLFNTSVWSIPELEANYLGMHSKALANPFKTIYYLPMIDLRCSLKCLESSISMAPPPATTAWVLIALLTIIIASLRDLCASSMYWEAPPLMTMVQALFPVQPVNILNLSDPS